MQQSKYKVKVKPFLEKPASTPFGEDSPMVYEGIESRKYTGVNLIRVHSELTNEGLLTGLPKFLGPDGKFYNRYYQLIPPGKIDFTQLDPNTEETEIFKLYNQSRFQELRELLDLPHPDEFDEYYQYDQALIDWKSRISPLFSHVVIPEVIGRSYYRPKMVNEKKRSDSRSLKDLIVELNISQSLEDLPETDAPTDSVLLVDQKSDPWDTSTYLPEPDPDDFETYEEYATAMKRWATICEKCIHTLPPHATQLQQMIPIQSVQSEQNKKKLSNEEAEDKALFVVKAGAKLSTLFGDHLNIFAHPDYLANSPEPTELVLGAEWETLSPDIQSSIWDLFDKIPHPPLVFSDENQNNNNNSPANPAQKLFAIRHGVLSRKPKTDSPLFRTVSTALQRSDPPTPANDPSFFDCPPEIFGKKVEYSIPKYDIQFDLFRLQTDSKYRESAQKAIMPIDYTSIRASQNAWDHPKRSPEQPFSCRRQVDEILSSTKYDEIGVSHITQVLKIDLFLDEFHDLMLSNREEEGIMRTHLSYLNNGLSVEALVQVLELFNCHSEELIKSRISCFIYNSLQSSTRFEQMIESLILQQDRTSLSYLAYALARFAAVPVSVFEMPIETKYLIYEIIGANSDHQFIEPMLIYYYLRIIQQVVLQNEDSFSSFKQYLEKTLTLCGISLKNTLQTHFPEFITTTLWSGLAHRSSSISGAFLFFAIRFLESPDLFEYAKNSAALFSSLLKIADSKFLHTQYAVRRIWESLLEQKDSLDEQFQQECGNPLKLLTAPLKKNGEFSLGTTLVFEAYCLILNDIREKKKAGLELPNFLFLLDSANWQNCFSKISNAVNKVTMETYILAKFVSELTHTFQVLGNISSEIAVKVSTKKPYQLIISSGVLFKHYVFISGATGPNHKLALESRTHILRSLRFLLKNGQIFEYVKKDIDSFNRIDAWCRDHENMNFNREAWKCFYQIIYYHPGVVELLLRGNTLSHFFDLVGTGYHNVIVANALHCVAQLFSMEATEMRKQMSGKPPTRGDKEKDRGLKSYKEDVKLLNNFFIQRSLFIKVHMIYKKLSYTEKGNYGGYFVELARFYHLIATSPSCDRIYKDTIKKPEYKKGIDDLKNMFGDLQPSGLPEPLNMISSRDLLVESASSPVVSPVSSPIPSKGAAPSTKVETKTHPSVQAASNAGNKIKSAFSGFGSFLKKKDKKN